MEEISAGPDVTLRQEEFFPPDVTLPGLNFPPFPEDSAMVDALTGAPLSYGSSPGVTTFPKAKPLPPGVPRDQAPLDGTFNQQVHEVFGGVGPRLLANGGFDMRLLTGGRGGTGLGSQSILPPTRRDTTNPERRQLGPNERHPGFHTSNLKTQHRTGNRRSHSRGRDSKRRRERGHHSRGRDTGRRREGNHRSREHDTGHRHDERMNNQKRDDDQAKRRDSRNTRSSHVRSRSIRGRAPARRDPSRRPSVSSDANVGCRRMNRTDSSLAREIRKDLMGKHSFSSFDRTDFSFAAQPC